MNGLQEFTSMKRQWQAQPQPLPDVTQLRERLSADNRAHWRILGIVTVISLVTLGTALINAWQSGEPEAWMAFAAATVFVIIVWTVALLISRGTWQPRDESVASHLDVSIRRCRAVVVAAPIGIMLYVAGLVGSVLWKQRMHGGDLRELLESPAVIIAGWIGAPLYAALMVWNARRQLQRLHSLEEIRRRLCED